MQKYGYLYYLYEDFSLCTGLLSGLEILLNFKFNREKTWVQLGNNTSLTPLIMPTKNDTFLVIHIFKTNLSNFFFKIGKLWH